jgi:hypothetical protein
MRQSSGVTGAAPIWHDVVEAVVSSDERMDMVRQARESMGLPLERTFERPKDIVDRSVCSLRSLNLLGPACTAFGTELVRRTSGTGADSATPLPLAGLGTQTGGDAAAATGLIPGTVGEGSDVWTIVPAVAVPAPPPVLKEGEQPPAWPPATLCQAGGPGRGMERTYAIAVLPLPIDPDEREDVAMWATQTGWAAVEPSTFCSPEMAASAIDLGSAGAWTLGPSGIPIARAEYRLGITPGTVLTETVTLTGTVSFDPSTVEYYKLELGAGEVPTEWITVGDTHREFLVNGPIEVLDAAALPAGPYVVRLVLVGKDGNFIQPPHSVPIVIGR